MFKSLKCHLGKRLGIRWRIKVPTNTKISQNCYRKIHHFCIKPLIQTPSSIFPGTYFNYSHPVLNYMHLRSISQQCHQRGRLYWTVALPLSTSGVFITPICIPNACGWSLLTSIWSWTRFEIMGGWWDSLVEGGHYINNYWRSVQVSLDCTGCC